MNLLNPAATKPQMTIAITGGSGFVGGHLTALLLDAGHEVILFSRTPRSSHRSGLRYATWHPAKKQIDEQALRSVDAVVQLAGAGIATQRWTKARKAVLRSSRVDATFFLHEVLKAFAPHCQAFISASAVGYYGADKPGSVPFHEDAPAADNFLGRLCADWERASLSAAGRYRSAVLRTGIVLGKDGGAYPRLERPVANGLRPIFGSGSQMMSWIHVQDLARLYASAIFQEDFSGVFNAVAPQPVSQSGLMRSIAQADQAWTIPVPVPAVALRLALGGAADGLLKSCTVSAEKVLKCGFSFRFGSIDAALRDIAGAGPGPLV
jgi:uncharacterized protein (TIGR01777 family)